MSTGEGIFSSTVLLVTAFLVWQITLHHKWKIAGKWLAIAGIAGLFLGIGVWSFNAYKNRPQLPISQSPVAQTELDGIHLGFTQLEVQLKRGKPDQVSEPTENSKHIEWQYAPRFNEDSRLTVIFDNDEQPKNQLTVGVICEIGSSVPFLGIEHFASEENIRKELGEPSYTSIRNDGLAKLISYSQWNAAFGLEENMVRTICISSSGKVAFSNEYIQKQ